MDAGSIVLTLSALAFGTTSAMHHVARIHHDIHNTGSALLHERPAQHWGTVPRQPPARKWGIGESQQFAQRHAEFDGITEAVLNDSTSVLCGWGKWLPELYLLGAPKSGTSSLAWELEQNGIRSTVNKTGVTMLTPEDTQKDVPYLSAKESEFPYLWMVMHSGEWDTQQAAEDWRQPMPECPSHDDSGVDVGRALYADYSATSLELVPPDASLTNSPVTAYGCNMSDINWPAALESFYGGLSPRLKFIIMFREPLSMLHSSYYHVKYASTAVGEAPTLLLGDIPLDDTFALELSRALDLVENGTMPLWLWGSVYGQQVKAYLQHFAASQFMLIPMNYYLYAARQEVCSALQVLLQYTISCEEDAPEINSHKHPGLEEDVPASSPLRTRFDTFMSPEIETLIEVLHLAYLQGAHLPGFHPQNVTTNSEVKDWLYAGW